jgi:hypothetical protein
MYHYGNHPQEHDQHRNPQDELAGEHKGEDEEAPEDARVEKRMQKHRREQRRIDLDDKHTQSDAEEDARVEQRLEEHRSEQRRTNPHYDSHRQIHDDRNNILNRRDEEDKEVASRRDEEDKFYEQDMDVMYVQNQQSTHTLNCQDDPGYERALIQRSKHVARLKARDNRRARDAADREDAHCTARMVKLKKKNKLRLMMGIASGTEPDTDFSDSTDPDDSTDSSADF